MNERRDVIRNLLAAMDEAEKERISQTDCGTVSQINVFSGASININVTNVDKSRLRVFMFEHCAVCEHERVSIYRKCHGIAKQYDVYPEMRRHMKARWHVKSMRELTDAALNDLMLYMLELEQQIQNVARL